MVSFAARLSQEPLRSLTTRTVTCWESQTKILLEAFRWCWVCKVKVFSVSYRFSPSLFGEFSLKSRQRRVFSMLSSSSPRYVDQLGCKSKTLPVRQTPKQIKFSVQKEFLCEKGNLWKKLFSAVECESYSPTRNSHQSVSFWSHVRWHPQRWMEWCDVEHSGSKLNYTKMCYPTK